MRNIILDKTVTTTAGAYSASDVIGGKITLDIGGVDSGELTGVVVIDDDGIAAAMKLYVFNSAVSTFADNAAFAPTIGDMKAALDYVAVAGGDYVNVNGNSFAIKSLLSSPLPYYNNNGILYVYAVLDGTPTFTSTSALTFRFIFRIDE